MRFLRAALWTISAAAFGAEASGNAVARSSNRDAYIWRTAPVGSSAQLVTLFCRGCANPAGNPSEIPLLSLLRDDLGDDNPENDRVTELWLLSYRRPAMSRRVLSAVPFFYWRVGEHREVKPVSNQRLLRPLIDMNALQHPVTTTIAQNVLQWTVLDPSTMPVRASSRAFRTNAGNHERLHLDEAIGYLRRAEAAQTRNENGESFPSERQLHTLLARLELRKTLLGGFVSERGAAQFGESAGIRFERTRSRNWELLRQCADKIGLYFETLSLGGAANEYAILWSPVSGPIPGSATDLRPIWKLLNMRPPSLAELRRTARSGIYSRPLDADGNLLPPGREGVRYTDLVPLGVYSLAYPKTPLLMVDFRHHTNIRMRALLQRSINDVTAGVIGISHFTNWYYYLAADLYDFVASRHGAAMNQAERLDCYSQFRVHLALDRELDPRLRAEIREKVDSLAINPLEVSPEAELNAARTNYAHLQQEAQDGRLLQSLDKDRRRELALADVGKGRATRQAFLHLLSFGTYTARVKPAGDTVAEVDRLRRAQFQLGFLDGLAQQNTPPEIAVDGDRITHSIAELQQLLPQISSERFRTRAKETLAHLKAISQDRQLQSECGSALALLRNLDSVTHTVALNPAVLHVTNSSSRSHE